MLLYTVHFSRHGGKKRKVPIFDMAMGSGSDRAKSSANHAAILTRMIDSDCASAAGMMNDDYRANIARDDAPAMVI